MELEQIARSNFNKLVERVDPYEQAVVQVYVSGKPYIRIGAGTHPGILYKFLLECQDAERSVCSEEKMHEFRNGVPDIEAGDYHAVGMGFARIVVPSRKVWFNGESMIYNLGINSEHLQRLNSQIDWDLKIENGNR